MGSLKQMRRTVAGDQVQLDVDVDERCRQVLRELERANASGEKTMDSALLHGSTQRFAVITLRKELNRELDRLLTLQVLERERAIHRSGTAFGSAITVRVGDVVIGIFNRLRGGRRLD